MQIVVDTWEGQLEIDEAAFRAGGVAGFIVRLNDMNGGHHKDEGFDKQWAEAGGFLRTLYFVYNPWVDGGANYTWLQDHLPADCPRTILIDIEVRKAGLDPAEYGRQVKIFLKALRTAGYTPVVYTGAWFLPLVAPWPKDTDYWWAQYPGAMHPDIAQSITWEALAAKIGKLTWPPANAASCPGPVRLWQCSGDRFILPGTTRALDISIWPGDLDSLREWFGLAPEVLPTRDECIDDLLQKNNYHWRNE